LEKIVKHDSWPIQPDMLNPPLLQLTSRKPLWLDLQPVDIKSRWRHNWKSAQVVNFSLSVWPHNPATRFWPPSATVVSAELFSHGTETLYACRRKWRLIDTDLCPCSKTQTMSCIVRSCPLTKLNDSLSRLHSADVFPGWPIIVHDTHMRKSRLRIPVFQRTTRCTFFRLHPFLFSELNLVELALGPSSG